jgi:glycosidase
MNRRFLLFLFFIASASSFLHSQSSDSTQARKVSTQQARHSEEWVRRGVIYEIYTRSFSPEGNFTGIEKGLPELNKLGVTILWLMPIHPVGLLHRKGTLGSPYSIQDYYAINPEFGTMDDFRRLVKRAHEYGFHLIIDLVANHTAWDSKLIKDHPGWFTKDSAGNIVSPNPDWTDVADLDYSQQGLRQYMTEMMKYWVHDVGIDGFRCDVAELVPTNFWEGARAALDSIKPVMMLSEGSYPEQHLKAFDATYGWNIYHALASIFKGEKTARALDIELSREEVTFPEGALRMRFSSNHDENAWDASDVEKFGVEGAKLAAVVVNTLPGIPLLYNGQEVGNRKRLGLFEKYSIDWQGSDEFRALYFRLFELRKYQPAIFGGEMIRIPSTNDKRLYAFARVSGPKKFIVLYNFDLSPFNGSVDLSSPKLDIGTHVTLTDAFTKQSVTMDIPPTKVIPLDLPGMGFRILQIEQETPHK